MDPILIVDDEKDNLEALQRLLRGQYNITISASPIEALQLISSHRYHVIVSDQRMPEMTGVELLEKAKKLSPLSTRILLTGYTDIESVIDAINRGQIYRYISKPWEPDDLKMTLRQANEAYLLRQELEDKNTALKEALADLTLLDRAKARFLSLVSHELNTPLTVLNAFIELLSGSKDDLSQELKKAVSSVEGASNRFSEIVQEVLTYVRLESENKLQKESVELEKLIKQAKEAVEKELVAKSLQIKMNIPGGIKSVVDPLKMITALTSLLKDAIRRAPKNSEIVLNMVSTDKGVELSLTREGEALSPTAFAPFESGQSEMHHQQNLGLALALCKTVISQHKGQMSSDGQAGKVNVKIVLPA